jgi:hypothetical protein
LRSSHRFSAGPFHGRPSVRIANLSRYKAASLAHCSDSKHPKSRPLFVHVVRCSLVISLAEILRRGDVNRDFRRRPTEEIGSDFFFVFFCEIILQPLSVNQRDNRLYVGIELYNAISRHSPLKMSLRLRGRKMKTPPASMVLACAALLSGEGNDVSKATCREVHEPTPTTREPDDRR